MKIRFHPFDLPLRHTFTISRGSSNVQKTLIVELIEDGVSGFGEATDNPYYGVTIDGMIAALRGIEKDLEHTSLTTPEELWNKLNPALKSIPFAQCALDLAAHDLHGKKHKKHVYQMWGLTLDKVPLSDYTIGIDTIDVMIKKLREFPDWPIYKIKLGTDHDLDIVRALRAETKAIFRVDANCAWTVPQTMHMAEELRGLGVEFIEQPLPANQLTKELFDKSVLPIIADESCQIPSDVEACVGRFHGINIKLVKCGGLTPARRMIARARELGMKTMVGCMTESSVGISAIAQLLPLLDYVDMDGAVLLQKDVARGVRVERGRAIFPTTPGCGVTLL